jgi:hypothetical protein
MEIKFWPPTVRLKNSIREIRFHLALRFQLGSARVVGGGGINRATHVMIYSLPLQSHDTKTE